MSVIFDKPYGVFTITALYENRWKYMFLQQYSYFI